MLEKKFCLPDDNDDNGEQDDDNNYGNATIGSKEKNPNDKGDDYDYGKEEDGLYNLVPQKAKDIFLDVCLDRYSFVILLECFQFYFPNSN